MSSPPQPPQGEAYTGVPGVGVPIQELIVRHSPSAALLFAAPASPFVRSWRCSGFSVRGALRLLHFPRSSVAIVLMLLRLLAPLR